MRVFALLTNGRTDRAPSVSGERTTPRARNFHVFSVARRDRGLREHFLSFQAAHDFIARFGSRHDIDRATRVTVARRRRGRAQEYVDDKSAHSFLSCRAGWPLPDRTSALTDVSPRQPFAQETRTAHCLRWPGGPHRARLSMLAYVDHVHLSRSTGRPSFPQQN